MCIIQGGVLAQVVPGSRTWVSALHGDDPTERMVAVTQSPPV